MNTIVFDKDNVIDLDKDVELNSNNLIIKDDTSINMYINKDTDLNININDNNNLDLFILCNSKINLIINLDSNSKCNLSIFGFNISGLIDVYLNKEESEFYLHNSSIYDKSCLLEVNTHHLDSNTISDIHNHGFTYKKGSLEYSVNGIVPKESSNCTCNQDNRIINLTDNICNIHPNLLIDNYDVVANHAAYIGTFKESDLFYLMSRGINKSKCYNLLLKAYLLDGLSVPDKERERIINDIESVGEFIYE